MNIRIKFTVAGVRGQPHISRDHEDMAMTKPHPDEPGVLHCSRSINVTVQTACMVGHPEIMNTHAMARVHETSLGLFIPKHPYTFNITFAELEERYK